MADLLCDRLRSWHLPAADGSVDSTDSTDSTDSMDVGTSPQLSPAKLHRDLERASRKIDLTVRHGRPVACGGCGTTCAPTSYTYVHQNGVVVTVEERIAGYERNGSWYCCTACMAARFCAK